MTNGRGLFAASALTLTRVPRKLFAAAVDATPRQHLARCAADAAYLSDVHASTRDAAPEDVEAACGGGRA